MQKWTSRWRKLIKRTDMAYLAKLEKDVCIYADHPLIWIKRWGFEKHRKCGLIFLMIMLTTHRTPLMCFLTSHFLLWWWCFEIIYTTVVYMKHLFIFEIVGLLFILIYIKTTSSIFVYQIKVTPRTDCNPTNRIIRSIIKTITVYSLYLNTEVYKQ